MYLGKQNYRMVNMSTQLPHNYISTVDPTIDVNPPIINMTWLNSTSGEVFVCNDNTTGENIWVNAQLDYIGFPIDKTGLLFFQGKINDTQITDQSNEANHITDFSNVINLSPFNISSTISVSADLQPYCNFNKQLMPLDPDGITVSFWLNQIDIENTGHGRDIISEYDITNSIRRYVCSISSDNSGVQFIVQSDGSSYDANEATDLVFDFKSSGWTHVVCTWFKGEKCKIYIDGVFKKEAANVCPSLSQQAVNTRLLNSYSSGGTQDGFYGNVSQVCLLSRGITEKEVLSLYGVHQL